MVDPISKRATPGWPVSERSGAASQKPRTFPPRGLSKRIHCPRAVEPTRAGIPMFSVRSELSTTVSRGADSKVGSPPVGPAERARGEPSWEPFSADVRGHAWTPVDAKVRRSGLYGYPWTPVDTAWRSTDQEVGCSSRPGARRIGASAGGSCGRRGESSLDAPTGTVSRRPEFRYWRDKSGP